MIQGMLQCSLIEQYGLRVVGFESQLWDLRCRALVLDFRVQRLEV